MDEYNNPILKYVLNKQNIQKYCLKFYIIYKYIILFLFLFILLIIIYNKI